MQTSCFALYDGAGRVSIARFAPRGTPAGFRVCRELAPGDWFNRVDFDEYRARYLREILDKLDPKRTYERLCRLAGGAEPVLLCWEKPPFTARNFCHRRMVADWFERTLGVQVPEREPQLALFGSP